MDGAEVPELVLAAVPALDDMVRRIGSISPAYRT
jgi:hypothetical protein